MYTIASAMCVGIAHGEQGHMLKVTGFIGNCSEIASVNCLMFSHDSFATSMFRWKVA